MEFKDYKEMNRAELKQLYQNLCEVDRNVTNDYKEKKKELFKLQEEKQKLLNIKKRIEYLNNSNTMEANKSISTAFTGLSLASLGYCAYLSKNFSNTPEEIIAIILSMLALYCSSTADYAFLSSYINDKKLIKNNNLLELEPKINSIDRQINNASQDIYTDEKILKRCRTNLPLLKDRFIKISKKNI